MQHSKQSREDFQNYITLGGIWTRCCTNMYTCTVHKQWLTWHRGKWAQVCWEQPSLRGSAGTQSPQVCLARNCSMEYRRQTPTYIAKGRGEICGWWKRKGYREKANCRDSPSKPSASWDFKPSLLGYTLSTKVEKGTFKWWTQWKREMGEEKVYQLLRMTIYSCNRDIKCSCTWTVCIKKVAILSKLKAV